MKRLLSATLLVLAMFSMVQPALAEWRGEGRGHDGRGHNEWRGEDWRWDRPHRYARPPREVILVYPPPPVVYMRRDPRVIYVEPPPPPIQAVPMSPPYTDTYGRYCREYQSTLTVGGTVQSGYGTACLQPDGSWQVVR